MKNDYTGGGRKISIPPTVLFSLLGIMDDVNKAVSSDFKYAGDAVFLLGLTRRELGGSELSDELGHPGGQAPEVDPLQARQRYLAMHTAMNAGLVTACHDLSDGGLAVALAEVAIGGRLGADVELEAVPGIAALTSTECLYSESASRLLVTVRPNQAMAFEDRLSRLSSPSLCARIGEVTADAVLTIRRHGATLLAEPVEELARAFKATLDW
jgi:phosphoribosylformylglycinamidine synthase